MHEATESGEGNALTALKHEHRGRLLTYSVSCHAASTLCHDTYHQARNLLRRHVKTVMEGYAQLAQRMYIYKDLAIVRRFDALNAQNILYLQAELMVLEAKLKKKQAEDCFSDEEEKRWSAHDWQTLQRVGQDPNGSETQWEIVSAGQREAERVQ